jgi:hypothetical protein
MDKVPVVRVSFRVFSIPEPIIIPPLLHTQLSPPQEVRQRHQAGRYDILGTKLGVTSLTRYLSGLGVKATVAISEVMII